MRMARYGLPIALVAFVLTSCAGPQSRRPPPPPAIETGQRCLATLSSFRVAATSIRFPADGACVIDAPVRAKGLGPALSPPATLGCGLAVRLIEFDRAVIQPEARRRFGAGVVTILDFGAYNCRAESSGRDRISQHGFGRAIDVAGFVMANGARVSVERDWDDDGVAGAFIHKIAEAACDYFSVVLTPDSNADHHNHLHLDVGPERLCGPA